MYGFLDAFVGILSEKLRLLPDLRDPAYGRCDRASLVHVKHRSILLQKMLKMVSIIPTYINLSETWLLFSYLNGVLCSLHVISVFYGT